MKFVVLVLTIASFAGSMQSSKTIITTTASLASDAINVTATPEPQATITNATASTANSLSEIPDTQTSSHPNYILKTPFLLIDSGKSVQTGVRKTSLKIPVFDQCADLEKLSAHYGDDSSVTMIKNSLADCISYRNSTYLSVIYDFSRQRRSKRDPSHGIFTLAAIPLVALYEWLADGSTYNLVYKNKDNIERLQKEMDNNHNITRASIEVHQNLLNVVNATIKMQTDLPSLAPRLT